MPDADFELGPHTLERFADVLDNTGADWVYSDYRDQKNGDVVMHPTIDYQIGSIRDTFDFGPLIGIRRDAAFDALERYGALSERPWTGLYELRLKMSVKQLPLRIPEPLYTLCRPDTRSDDDKHFDYVDPRNEDMQRDYEASATEHLKNIGAYLAPMFKPVPTPSCNFPVVASVVIPVRNRERTIADAVNSIVTQKTDFPFNTVVVDNHSTDGTPRIMKELASKHPNVVHLVPDRNDLGIGGCWSYAVHSPQCGRYAIQLDSDDIYSGDNVLQQIVDTLKDGPYAMVVGSYRVVNMNLEELPAGVIDHREWTRDNGRNNLLRVNGIGAPRAFDANVFRSAIMPNVSYGEDYALALRISRDYEVGRIYESVYLCRRWEGNTDAALPLETANRYDTYKDRIRTMEILARRTMNEKGHVGK